MILFFILLIPTVFFILKFCFFKSSDYSNTGKEGEKEVERLLSFLPSDEYIVLNDMMFSQNGISSQIDHIVISKFGIFVIETKSHKGRIFGNYKKDNWTQSIWGRKYPIYNPIWQNERHIKFLINKFPDIKEKEQFIHSLIVFIRAEKLRINGERSESVIWSNELLKRIRINNNEIMEFAECDRIAVTLRAANCVDLQQRFEHNIRASAARIYHENKIKKEICPVCGGKLILRKGKYGNFYGCSNYPRCKFLRKIC